MRRVPTAEAMAPLMGLEGPTEKPRRSFSFRPEQAIFRWYHRQVEQRRQRQRRLLGFDIQGIGRFVKPGDAATAHTDKHGYQLTNKGEQGYELLQTGQKVTTDDLKDFTPIKAIVEVDTEGTITGIYKPRRQYPETGTWDGCQPLEGHGAAHAVAGISRELQNIDVREALSGLPQAG